MELSAYENLGQMHRANVRTGAGKCTLNLHETAWIERDDGARASAQDRLNFGLGHGAREFRELHRESAAESAALLRRLHLTQFESSHVRQQTPRRIFHPKLAQGVTPVMERDNVFHMRSDILHSRHLGE